MHACIHECIRKNNIHTHTHTLKALRGFACRAIERLTENGRYTAGPEMIEYLELQVHIHACMLFMLYVYAQCILHACMLFMLYVYAQCVY
jgi:hypothetical protein